MKYLLWYIILFLIIFVVLYIFDFVIKDKKDNLGLSKGFRYITKKYNLNMDKSRVRILAKIIVLANAFILSIPMYVVFVFDLNYFAILGISFIIFIILFITIYNLIGCILKKKGW